MPQETWKLLQQVFTVETIMTGKDDLRTAPVIMDASELARLATEANFDLIPLTEGDHISSVYVLANKQMEPVGRQWLVSRDTPIPDLLRLFVDSKRLGFFVFYGQDIIGLVTPADLNKVPARLYCYRVLAELELALERLLRQRYKTVGEQEGKMLLGIAQPERNVILGHWRRLVKGNAETDLVTSLGLPDLMKLTLGIIDLRPALRDFQVEFSIDVVKVIKEFRDRTMHPVKPLVAKTAGDLKTLSRDFALVDAFLAQLSPQAQSADFSSAIGGHP